MKKFTDKYSCRIHIFNDIEAMEPDIYEAFNLKTSFKYIDIEQFVDRSKIISILKKYMPYNMEYDSYCIYYSNSISLVFFYKSLADEYKILYKLNKYSLYDLIKEDILNLCEI